MIVPPFFSGIAGEERLDSPGSPRSFLTIEDLIRQGWHIFMQYPGGFIGFTLLVLLVYGAITGASSFLSATLSGGIPGPDAFDDGALGLQTLLVLTIAVPLTAGYYVVALKLAREESVVFEDFFSGFRYWPALVLASILVSVLTALGFLLFILPGIYLSVAYVLVIPVIVDGEVNVWEALEISRKAITRRWFTTFFLIVLLAILNIVGILALCVGMLITIPLTYCTLTALYLDLIESVPDM